VQRGNLSGVSYDLSKKVDKEQITIYNDINFFSFNDYKTRNNQQTHFEMIIEDVQKLASENSENLLRICISSIGSPLWYSETFADDLLRFLVQLKSIVRYNDNIVCFLTMPLHLINLIDDQLVFKIRKLVDSNVNLESFDNVDKQTNAVFKQYHGLVHIKKLLTLNALQSHKPESFDLAFKLKSHRFVIEKLHLPPELQDNEKSNAPSMSCTSSAGGNKSLDF
jgi:elongator complex protein 4